MPARNRQAAQTALEDGIRTGLTSNLNAENLNMYERALILWLATQSQREEPSINDTEHRPDENTADPDSSTGPRSDSSPVPSDLYTDPALCPCGAQTVPGSLCRKCSARATWSRRRDGASRRQDRTQKNQDRPADRTDRRTGTGPKSRRPNR